MYLVNEDLRFSVIWTDESLEWICGLIEDKSLHLLRFYSYPKYMSNLLPILWLRCTTCRRLSSWAPEPLLRPRHVDLPLEWCKKAGSVQSVHQ